MDNVELYHGDCLEMMKGIEPGSVDAIITDLPYGTTACSWDVIIPFKPMWEAVRRVLKKNGVFTTTASQPFTSALVMSNVDNYKYEWIWEKPKATGYASVKHRPMKAHENIQVFYGNIYNPQMEKGEPYRQPRKNINYDKTMNGAFKVRSADYEFKDNEGTRQPRSVLKFRNSYYDDGPQLHPTQKPVALYEYLIRTYSDPGETVLDFCMGSGTTGEAAIRTGRRFIGIEKERKYFEDAKKRIKNAQPALF